MARHTYPKRREDETSYPVRILVKIPPRGFGGLLDEIGAWLREQDIKAANHPAPHNSWHASAWYFRSLDQAAKFLAAFPLLELADRVSDEPSPPPGEPLSSGRFM